MAETQLPAAQTMPVPHVVPSGWLASWSTQTGVPVVHAVAPWWQGLPGAQAAPTVQVLQTPSLHTMFVPQAAPFALSVPWSWQAGAPLEQSVAPSWHGLLGVQATSAVHGPQIPLLHTMLAPQAVPSARLVPRSSQAEDPAPHESEPAWQGLAGVHVAPAMAAYSNTIVASSYSKALSLAGERIGYVAANPAIAGIGTLMDGLVLANRILGFVNAPALMQRLVTRMAGRCVDVTPYKRNRDVLVAGLTEAGFKVIKPEGAFYLFPQSPTEDDVAFCREMLEHLVLVVPGRGFGLGGYFRLAYCVAPEVVDGALPAFREVGKKYFGIE